MISTLTTKLRVQKRYLIYKFIFVNTQKFNETPQVVFENKIDLFIVNCIRHKTNLLFTSGPTCRSLTNNQTITVAVIITEAKLAKIPVRSTGMSKFIVFTGFNGLVGGIFSVRPLGEFSFVYNFCSKPATKPIIDFFDEIYQAFILVFRLNSDNFSAMLSTICSGFIPITFSF